MKSPHIHFTTIPSPIGQLTLVASPIGLMAIYMEAHTKPPGDRTHWQENPTHPTLIETEKQLHAYFAGTLHHFHLPLHLIGTPFQKTAWQALLKIPYGQTRSYSQQATLCGKPTATRAIGTANSRNPISIIIPCHRVIGKNGTLTGYGGGLERKHYLLQHEQTHHPSTPHTPPLFPLELPTHPPHNSPMDTFEEKISKALASPENQGEMADADTVGTVGSPECGDMMRMWLKFTEKDGKKVIDRASFQAFGCQTAIAVASVATRLLQGKTPEEARHLSATDLAGDLGALPPMKIHCGQLVEGALKNALNPSVDNHATHPGIEPTHPGIEPTHPHTPAHTLLSDIHSQKPTAIRIVPLND